MTHRLSLHIPEPFEGVELAPWFAPVPEGALFRSVGRPQFFEQQVDVVVPETALAIVMSNNFKTAPDAPAREYIARYADMGERFGIPVFVFSLGDLNDKVTFDPRVRVLRLSVYRSTMRPQDILMPTLTEDLGAAGIALRAKAERPVVGFCGQAGYKSLRQWARFMVKNTLRDIESLWSPSAHARKIGVYWRRKAIQACRHSPGVETNFILRRSFSGARSTIELDPVQARRDFIENVINTDFVLAPKGDGNYSNRFLEALSLGRIPVLIDTDAVLPFEREIDYTKICVRVPMERVSETPRYIREFYDAMDEHEWQRRQRLARDTYERYLTVDAFFAHFFAAYVLKRPVVE